MSPEIHPRLLEFVRCPAEGGDLEWKDHRGLVCLHCGAVYPVTDGIPSFIEANHNDWDDVYGEPTSLPRKPNYRTVERFAYFRSELRGHSFETAFEIGCGPSLFARELIRQGRLKNYVGLDSSLGGLRKLPRENGMHLVHGDALRLPFARGAADLVLSFGVVMLFAEWRSIVLQLIDCLKPGGLILFAEGVAKEHGALWRRIRYRPRFAGGAHLTTGRMDRGEFKRLLEDSGELRIFHDYESPFRAVVTGLAVRTGAPNWLAVPLMNGCDTLSCDFLGRIAKDFRGRGVIAAFRKPA